MTVDGLEDLPRARPLYRREYGALGRLKAALYAAARIPDYWVVDRTREEIVVHREPTGPTFAAVTRHRDVVRALRHPRVVADVRALLR